MQRDQNKINDVYSQIHHPIYAYTISLKIVFTF